MTRKAAAKMHDESVPLAEVEAGTAAFERRIAALEKLHQQVYFVDGCPDPPL